MTHDQQKVWLTESGARSSRHTRSQRSVSGQQPSESAMYGSTKHASNLSVQLDDSSISSSSNASDCDDEIAVHASSKRFIFSPYWNKSEHDRRGQADEGSSSASSLREHPVTIRRRRYQPEQQTLQDVLVAALDLSRAPVAEDGPRWQVSTTVPVSTIEPATILPSLLRDLSFADALLLPDEAPDSQIKAQALTHSRSIDSIGSMSSILKNGSACSSEQTSSKGSMKNKPPVSFDPRVQVIIFQEDKTTPGRMKLPPWLSRSFSFLLDEFGTSEDI